MYTLYYSPGTASMAVHLALLEIGAPHELRLIDFDARGQKDPDYLRLNPNGLVPTLVVEGVPYYECAALLLLLGERHPESGLSPAPDTPERGLYLHGQPWRLAPAVQKQVPMLLWLSDNSIPRLGINTACLRSSLPEPRSHDHLSHTLLGLAGIETKAYRPNLDLIASCRPVY